MLHKKNTDQFLVKLFSYFDQAVAVLTSMFVLLQGLSLLNFAQKKSTRVIKSKGYLCINSNFYNWLDLLNTEHTLLQKYWFLIYFREYID